MNTKVLSLGGSIVAPEKPDTQFLGEFVRMTREWISSSEENRLVLVVGGGAPARIYQNAYTETCTLLQTSPSEVAADWIGIMATRINAQLVKAVFGELCENDVVYNPTEEINFKGKVLVASGWKPGFSSDNDAVLLAKKFGANTVVNLSNIEKVFTDDPKKNPEAKPLDEISWKEFRAMVGDEWTPGKNVPFDPIASREAESANLTVICSAGKNIENTRRILHGESYVGTTIRN